MIIFDIETRGLPAEQILAEAPPFNPDEVALGNRKKPEVIAEYIAEQKAKYERDIVEKAALNATTATVIAIGVMIWPTAQEWILNGEEQPLLEEFWDKWNSLKNSKWVGHNIFDFDLPFLIRRSWINDIPVPTDVKDGRYFNRRFEDTLELWRMHQPNSRISLDRLARLLKLGHKTASGAQFAEMWDLNREEAIEYLRNDLRLTAKVAQRLGVGPNDHLIGTVVSNEEWRAMLKGAGVPIAEEPLY